MLLGAPPGALLFQWHSLMLCFSVHFERYSIVWQPKKRVPPSVTKRTSLSEPGGLEESLFDCFTREMPHSALSGSRRV